MRAIPLVIFLVGCAHAPASNLEVTLVPSIHRLHLDPAWHYSLGDLVHSVEASHPDLLCLEMEPDSPGSLREGLFPPEAALLAEEFSRQGVKFVPADWRADRGGYESLAPAFQREAAARAAELQRRLREAKDRIAFLMSREGKDLTRRVHDFYLAHGGEAVDGFWSTRNQKIVDRCMAEARQQGARRVTMVYGVDHMYALEEDLRRDPTMRVVDGERASGSYRVPPSVVARWRKNLDGLATLEQSGTAPERQWVRESRRPEELRLFLREAQPPQR